MLIKKELRRLTKNINNPKRDKRHQHGINSLEFIPEGTLFELLQYDGEKPSLTFYIDGEEYYTTLHDRDEGFSESILENSIESNPVSVDEIVDSRDITARCLLRGILKHGFMNSKQLDDLAILVYKESLES